MSNLSTRRGFLALSGTGVAASLAGCSQLDSMGQSNDEETNAVTLSVTPDREKLTSLEEEIQADIDDGNLSDQEAAQEFEERRRELTKEATTSFEESAGENDISVEESEPKYGLLRVTGPDDEIMDALQNGAVGGIYPGEQYELFVQQQQRQEQQQAIVEEQQQAQEGNETNGSDSGNVTDESGSGNETIGSGNESPDSGNETAE
ncbi:hypothetical protein HYG81_01305 [Natrinema zhouii]|uniref:Uncharacterized protein n=1 Tax=Natrinema zhouii TaxID=1710539 RepID=A0A7D6CRJ2_9EURY|nr:hypothetical protein [Natrinema zhouii]QLK26290.1 hypothetical protein HYG81_01305 [Natrinema zhouii]